MVFDERRFSNTASQHTKGNQTMTTKEINKRIADMDAVLFAFVLRMIREGYGASGIKHETGATLKQINAVFALTDLK